MRSTVYVRNFESTLRLLAERGHSVHVVADAHLELDPTDLIGRLCREFPRITHTPPPRRRPRGWSILGNDLRRGLDYLRYLQPEYANAPKLRRRAEQKAPPFVISALRRPLVDTRAGRWLLARAIDACDRALPRDPVVDAFVREHAPDLVLVTPLVEPGSPQSEFLRSARALGIRTGLCVYSWDNLTNKGLVHDPLDVVTVWNAAMKEEAVTLHHLPAERVVITGAAAYDHWFAWKPRRAREAFCDRVGLDASRPYVLYLCSSKFIAPDELPFVRTWIEHLRASSSTLREVGVLVRPHPQNTDVWRDADLRDLRNVAIWPRAGGNPVDEDSRADYFDSIHHSAAVVGVNTSAQIESAIVGRGVHTWLATEFRETQEGTLHFKHLRSVNGGLLHVATTVDEHLAQLEQAVRDPAGAAERCRRFVEAFVRPYGVGEAATPRLVAALEATAARAAVAADSGPWWGGIVRAALSKTAAELEDVARARGSRKVKTKPPREKSPQPIAPAAAPTEPVPAPPTGGRAFEHYLYVRDRVRALREMEPASEAVTESERRMLSVVGRLWDATPDTIAALRQQGEAISGVRASDYGPAETATRARLERDLRRLLARGDRALWVDEPKALGGFGFNGLAQLYNEDTLRFFRVLSLLQDAAVLKEFVQSTTRRTVWEIGGGWGGFAYQFKTLCPDVTYVITGQPELFLLSAVYLMALFPTAHIRFYDHRCPDAFWRDWQAVDFAFAPESAVAELQPPSLHLTVDVAALERMTPGRIDRHVRRAYDLGCSYLMSAGGARDGQPDGASVVSAAIDRFYWRHPVSAPLYAAKRLSLSRESADSTYLLGWRRLHA